MKQREIYSLKNDRVAKARPCLIVSKDNINGGYDVTVVPFNGSDFANKKDKPFCVPFYCGEFGLSKDCVAKCDEIARIRKSDLNRSKIGTIDTDRMAEVIEAVNWCISCEPEKSKAV
jgi:mRNA-degrading endonuclease toxin of MazEF toxin-antitoxin module